jgi:hypothetical protein
MSPVKKLIFAPLFLAFTISTLYFYKIILIKYLDVYFGNYGGIYEFALLSLPLMFIGLTYCLFVTFTQDFKYAIGGAIIAGLTPFLFLNTNLSIVISAGLLISFILAFFNLQSELRSYTNFQSAKLLKSPIKLLNTFILLTLTFGYFLNANSIIQTQGFKIPDSLMDWAIDLSLKGQGIPVKGVKYLAQIPTLSQEQINLLKQNPDILKQYGLDPDVDELVPAENTTSAKSSNKNAIQVIPSLPGTNLKDIIKAQMSTALDAMIKPYLFAIPMILAVLFYSLAGFTLWFFSLFLSPILTIIFSILEKTGFVKYEKEMREVKKIII